MKKTKTLEERYPVVEESGEIFTPPPEPKPPLVPPKRISRRSKDDLRPVSLEAVHNSEKRMLLGLCDFYRQLQAENHPGWMHLAQKVRSLLEYHQLREEIIRFDEYQKRKSASESRTGVTKEAVEEHKAAWLVKHNGKIRGWQKNVLIDLGIKDSRTLKRIME
ncbi:MAG: hypothetical protein ACOYBR_03785 [Fluviibacter sp.]